MQQHPLPKIQKYLYVLSWALVAGPMVLLVLAGFFIIPFMILFSNNDTYNEGVPKWFPWGNYEEGCPRWWLRADKEWYKAVFPRWWWFAIRNPLNNTRYWFKDRTPKYDTNWDQSIPMEAQQMINLGVQDAYRWAYNGAFAGWRRVWLEEDGTYSERWFGWKVGSKIDGLGFTAQNRRHRKVGT
jgi:hypothetical protein